MFRRTVLAAGAVLALAAGAPTMALAKDAWPVKTITLVQPYAPGGTSDMLARIIANELEKRITASVIVESKAGANGKLFGSVTSKDVAAQIKKDLGVEIDKRKIVMDDIKTFGTVQAEVKVYAGITAKILVQVTEA